MNPKEIAEIVTVANQCEAKLDGVRFELLAKLVSNTNRIVEILESQMIGGQMELPLAPAPAAPKVEEPKAPVVAKPVASKKPVVAKAAPVAQPAAPVLAKAEAELPTKDEVMTALVDFIGNHPEGEEEGEAALEVMLKELGNYTQFPEVPAEKYAELLEKINQA